MGVSFTEILQDEFTIHIHLSELDSLKCDWLTSARDRLSSGKQQDIKTGGMNSTKVQNPRRKMQVYSIVG